MARKIVSGPVRNKDRTKKKLLKTVGTIIKTKGFHELKISTIAKMAGVDKKLVYDYFGTVKNLINQYLRSQDYGSSLHTSEVAALEVTDHGKKRSKKLIESMFQAVSKNKELQKIIVWELYGYNDILRKLSDHREELGEALIGSFLQPHFRENHKKYRAILAILISSSYYLNIHKESNGSLFCGLDISNPEDSAAVTEVMSDIIDFAYEQYASENVNL